MTREEAEVICTEIRKWDNRPFITPDKLLGFAAKGQQFVTTVRIGGVAHHLDAFTYIGRVCAAMHDRADPVVECETIDGDPLVFRPSEVKSWNRVMRAHLACMYCWKRYAPHERRQGSMCEECYASDECPKCGGSKEPNSWECQPCFDKIMGGFVSEVAGAFGTEARKVDLAKSMEAGEWVDEEP